MRVLAQSAYLPSRVPPSKIDQEEDGPRSPNLDRMQCLSRVLMVKSTIVRGTALSRPSLAEVIWSPVPSGSNVLGSYLDFPSTVAVSSPEDRSTAGSRPSVTVSSPEDRSTAGILSSDPRLPSIVAVSSSEDCSTACNRPSVTVFSSSPRNVQEQVSEPTFPRRSPTFRCWLCLLS